MATMGNAGDGGWDRGDDQREDGGGGDRRRNWGHYQKLYDARIRRKKILRTQVGEVRARLNRQLHAEARALRRAAREDLRGEVFRLEAEEMERRISGVFNRIQSGGARESSSQSGASTSGNHHARDGISRRPLVNDQGEAFHRDPRVRRLQENNIQYTREQHANTIRRLTNQQQMMIQQQRTVNEVRRVRQQMWNDGREEQGRQQEGRQEASTYGQGRHQQHQSNAGRVSHHPRAGQYRAEQANHQLQAGHRVGQANHQLQTGHHVGLANHQIQGGQASHQLQAGADGQNGQHQHHQGQVQPDQEIICDLAEVRSFTLVLEREDATIWQVYTTHEEIIALFINRRLAPVNNFWGVHRQELYGILAATDVGYNGHSMTIMTASITWTADGSELWDRDDD